MPAWSHHRLVQSSLVGLGAAVCFAAVAGCGGSASPAGQSADQPAEKPAAAPQVVVSEACLRIWPQTVRVQGVLREDEQSVVGAEIAGRVDAVPVDLGSVVQENQPLVLLDTRLLDLEVQQAQAQLRQAGAAIGLDTDTESEDDLDPRNAPPVVLERSLLDEAQAQAARGRQLASRGAVTQAEIDNFVAQEKAAQARYNSALNRVDEQIALVSVRRAELALARQRQEDAKVLAPFDGVVMRRHVSPGESVQAGQAVVTLIRTDKLRFTTGVPENKAAGVRVGQTVLIRPIGAPPTEATVTRVSPSLDQLSRSLRIEADVSNESGYWRAGLFAEAEIVVDPEASSLSVPLAAVSEFAGVEKVWLVRDGRASEQPDRTGRREGAHVEILDGLAVGDLVLNDGAGGQAGPVVAVLERPEVRGSTAAGTGVGLSE
jgi:RND family efflux transporter MFP subunit